MTVSQELLNDTYRVALSWSPFPERDWGGEFTYPGLQIDYDVFGDFIGVQLWQSEYSPPRSDFGDLPLFLMITVIALFILLAALSRWGKKQLTT